MAYNKYFNEVILTNKKEGAVLYKKEENSSLDLSKNIIIKNDFSGYLTSSNNLFEITGNLNTKNSFSSNNFRTNRISFDDSDSISLYSNVSRNLVFNARCEVTGNTHFKTKLLSTGITGSISEVAPGKELIKGQNGISVKKLKDANNRIYFEITAGDSNNNEESSPINTSIITRTNGSTTTMVQNGIETSTFNSIKNDLLTTSSNTHTIKVHKYYANLFLGESLILIFDLTSANDSAEVVLDFTWTANPGTNNSFNAGNKIKIGYIFKENSSQKVLYHFDRFDSDAGKNKYKFFHEGNNNDPTLSISSNKLIIERNINFAGASDDILYCGNGISGLSGNSITFDANTHMMAFI